MTTNKDRDKELKERMNERSSINAYLASSSNDSSSSYHHHHQ